MAQINDTLVLHLPLDKLGPAPERKAPPLPPSEVRPPSPELELPRDLELPQLMVMGAMPDLGDKGIGAAPKILEPSPEPLRPEIVPDDLFGGCMHFGGKANYPAVDASKMSALAEGAGLTVCAWFSCAELAPTPQCLLSIAGAGEDRIRLLFSDGTLALSLDGKETRGRTKLEAHAWYHVAFSSAKANRETALFINGVSECQTQAAEPLAGKVAGLTLGSDGAGHFFTGRIANLRIYQGVLSEDDLKKVYTDMDQSAQAAFKLDYPIDFKLTTNEADNVLYISDDSGMQSVTLEIANSSGRDIAVRKKEPASATEYNFKLDFKPNAFEGIVEVTDPAKFDAVLLKKSPEFWSGRVIPNTTTREISVELSYAGSEDLKLEAGGTLRFELNYASAGKRGGARGSTIRMLYQGITFKGDAAELKGSRIAHVDIVNQRGKKSIPLYAGFVGSNVVLNDGQTKNTLILSIANLSQTSDINLYPDDTEESSKFAICFPLGTQDLALGDIDKASGIKVEPVKWTKNGWVEDTDWGKNPPSFQGTTYEWAAFAGKKTVLMAGKALYFKISGIITDKPSGESIVKILYEDIPGYWDGALTTLIQKRPLTYDERRVGIGIAAPEATLHIINENQDANGNTIILGPTQSSNLRLGYNAEYSWIQSHGSKPLAINLLGNNVGIGTANPTAKLTVAGPPFPPGIEAGTAPHEPDGTLRMEQGGLIFGGANQAGREYNSATISVGKMHTKTYDSMAIIGMSDEKGKSDTRRIDMWHEGGLTCHGPVAIQGIELKIGEWTIKAEGSCLRFYFQGKQAHEINA